MELSQLKEWIGIFGRGLVMNSAPRVVGGAINAACHEWKLDVAKITWYVQHNESLWRGLTSEQWEEIGKMGEVLGDLDFITPQLMIDSIKADFPKVASLLVNWPEGFAWLEKQVSDLKGGVIGADIDKTETGD